MAAETATVKPGNGGAPAGRFAFTVEMGDSKNRCMVWPLDQRNLRGRWRRDNIAGVTTDDRFALMPDLPGHCITMDAAKKAAIIFDPLSDPKNERILKKAQAVAEAIWGTKCAGDQAVRNDDMSDDEVKTWAYWVRRYLDARQCRVVRGTVPEMAEILALPGRVAHHNFDQGSAAKDKQEPPAKYVPMKFQEEDLMGGEGVHI